MASRIQIRCGKAIMEWNDLSAFFHRLGKTRQMAGQFSQGALYRSRPSRNSHVSIDTIVRTIKKTTAERFCRDWSRMRELEFRSRDSDRPLLELCASFGTGICQNLVDKVFGLHSLASQCCRNAVLVDYAVSWEVICARMVHHYIQQHINGDPNEFAVGTLQEFHRTLGITRKDWMPRTKFESYFYLSDSWDMDILSSLQVIRFPLFAQVDGNIRGSISCVSSSLDIALDPRLIAKHLSDLPGIGHLYTKGEVTGEVDLVTLFEQPPLYATTTE